MPLAFSIFLLAATLLFGGCAIRPEPVNFSRVNTFQIVRQIRCETRSAAITLALQYAGQHAENQELVDRLSKLETSSVVLRPEMFEGTVRRDIELFLMTGVAYNFSLEMTEINNVGTDLGFFRRLTYRTFDLGVQAGLNRQRQNTRSFTVTDRIGDLVGGPSGCSDEPRGPNYIYPMTGRIGVDNLLKSFVYMTLFNNLGGYRNDVDPTKLGGPPTMVDALEFETTVYGNATPKIAFNPVGQDSLELMNASISTTNSRKDRHRVVMGLALAGLSDAKLRQVRAPYVGRFVTAAARTDAEVAAAVAVDQVISENAISRTTLVDR